MDAQENRGRIGDIPYASSPPILFTFRQTANLSAGFYDFGGVTGGITKIPFNPDRPILPNVLYFFNTITFAMDIEQNDYEAAIVNLPQFSAYVQADSAGPALREPIVLPQYLLNVPYPLSFIGAATVNRNYPGAVAPAIAPSDSTTNRFLGAVTGKLSATASLEGKTSITAIITLSAVEIKDNAYIEGFRNQAKISEVNMQATGKVL